MFRSLSRTFWLGAIGLLLFHLSRSAQADPPPGFQAAQAHAAHQQMMTHVQQQTWHTQQVAASARDAQNSGWNRGGNGGNGWQGAGAGVNPWQPGDRFQSGNLEVAYQQLQAVNYHALSPVERGQYKAACRKFRLAVNHGYQYR